MKKFVVTLVLLFCHIFTATGLAVKLEKYEANDLSNYPFHALIETDDDTSTTFVQGVLIEKRWILTSGIAIRSMKLELIKVIIGETLYLSWAQAIVFQDSVNKDGIALIQLAGEVDNIPAIDFTAKYYGTLKENDETIMTSFKNRDDLLNNFRICKNTITTIDTCIPGIFEICSLEIASTCAISDTDAGTPIIIDKKVIGIMHNYENVDQIRAGTNLYKIDYLLLKNEDIEWINKIMYPIDALNYPWQAIIKDDTTFIQGVLIDKQWILTSAKALNSLILYQLQIICDGESYAAEKIIFQDTEERGSIALIQLNVDVLNDIKPIDFTSDYYEKLEEGDKIEMTTFRNIDSYNELHLCQIEVVAKETCTTNKYPICSLVIDSTCNILDTDKGSPMIINNKQIGIIYAKKNSNPVRIGINRLDIDYIPLKSKDIEWINSNMNPKQVKNYRWHALIKDDNTFAQGVLIHKQWILTSAKAINNLILYQLKIIFEGKPAFYAAEKILYQNTEDMNGIAILKLNKGGPDDIAPIDLTSNYYGRLNIDDKFKMTTFIDAEDLYNNFHLCENTIRAETICSTDNFQTCSLAIDSTCTISDTDTGSPIIFDDKQIGIMYEKKNTYQTRDGTNRYDIDYFPLRSEDVEWINSNIDPIRAEDYPWQVLIKDDITFFQGALIDKQWILTAAIALEGKTIETLQVIIGENILSSVVSTHIMNHIALIQIEKHAPDGIVPIDFTSDYNGKFNVGDTFKITAFRKSEDVLNSFSLCNNTIKTIESCIELICPLTIDSTCTIVDTDVGSPIIFKDKQIGIIFGKNHIFGASNRYEIDYISLRNENIEWINSKINPQETANYPWHVHISRQDDIFSQGALIHNNWVVTSTEALIDEDEYNLRVIIASNFYLIETYNKHVNGIALLKLEKSVPFDIVPIDFTSYYHGRLNVGNIIKMTTFRKREDLDPYNGTHLCENTVITEEICTTEKFPTCSLIIDSTCVFADIDKGSPMIFNDKQIGIMQKRKNNYQVRNGTNRYEIDYVPFRSEDIEWLNSYIHPEYDKYYSWHVLIKDDNTFVQGVLIHKQWILTSVKALNSLILYQLQVIIEEKPYMIEKILYRHSEKNGGIALLKLNNVDPVDITPIDFTSDYYGKLIEGDTIEMTTIRNTDFYEGFRLCENTVIAERTCSPEKFQTCSLVIDSTCTIIETDAGSPMIFKNKQIGIIYEKKNNYQIFAGTNRYEVDYIPLTSEDIKWVNSNIDPIITSDYPWHVLIRDNNTFVQGVLIHKQWILTSAKAINSLILYQLQVILDGKLPYAAKKILYQNAENKESIVLIQLNDDAPDYIKPIDFTSSEKLKENDQIEMTTFRDREDPHNNFHVCENRVIAEEMCSLKQVQTCSLKIESTCIILDTDTGSPIIFKDRQIGIMYEGNQVFSGTNQFEINYIPLKPDNIGWINSKIYPQTITDYPWHVLIKDDNIFFQGVLVHEYMILTSAKPLFNIDVTKLQVIIGGNEVYSVHEVLFRDERIALVILMQYSDMQPITFSSGKLNVADKFRMTTFRDGEDLYNNIQLCENTVTAEGPCTEKDYLICSLTIDSTCTISDTDLGSPIILNHKQIGIMLEKINNYQQRVGTNRYEIDYIPLTDDDIDWLNAIISPVK